MLTIYEKGAQAVVDTAKPAMFDPSTLLGELKDKGYEPINLGRMAGEHAAWNRKVAYSAGHFVPPLPQYPLEIEIAYGWKTYNALSMNGVEVFEVTSLTFSVGIKPAGVYDFFPQSTAMLRNMLRLPDQITRRLHRPLLAIPMHNLHLAPWLYRWGVSYMVFSPQEARIAGRKSERKLLAPPWYKEFCRETVRWGKRNGATGKAKKQ